MRILWLMVFAAVTGTGCASPQISDVDRERGAQVLYAVNSCVASGELAPDLGGSARIAVMRKLGAENSRWAEARVDQMTRELVNKPTAPECRQMAMRISEGRERTSASQAAPAYTPPRTVNCSTVMGWTHCTQF